MKKFLILTGLGLFIAAYGAAGVVTSFVPTPAMACEGNGC
jgi:hypothetical protein